MNGKAIYMTEGNGWYCPHGPHRGIDWGKTVPITAKTPFDTKEEAEEHNLWMFNRSSLPDSEGFEIFSWGWFNECYRALLTEMFEAWKECQIV